MKKTVLLEIREEKQELGVMIEESTFRLAIVENEHDGVVYIAPNEIKIFDIEFYEDFYEKWIADYGLLELEKTSVGMLYKIKNSKDDTDKIGYDE